MGKLLESDIKTVDIDKGFAKSVASMIKANNVEVSVGYFPFSKRKSVSAGSKSSKRKKRTGRSLYAAEVAVIQEFGSRKTNVPERSFMRSTFDTNSPIYIREIKKMFGKLVDPSDKTKINDVTKRIGGIMSFDIKRKIIALKSPPLSERRIREKGHSNPLVDTKQMLNATTWVATKDKVITSKGKV